MNLKYKKVAIVHDFLVQYGGAEKVLEVFCEIFLAKILYRSRQSEGSITDKPILGGRCTSKSMDT